MSQVLSPASAGAQPPAPAADPARGPMGRDRASDAAVALGLYALSFLVALALSALLVAVTGGSPSEVFTAMWDGSVGSLTSLGQTLDEATPLLVVGLGAVIATRAGMVNIGQEGQLMLGALAGTLVALKVPGPGPLVLVLALLGAFAGGALWAGIAALLRFWRNVDEVISTLLLTFIAFQVVSLAVGRSYLLREGGLEAGRPPQSAVLGDDTRLPVLSLGDLDVISGVFLALGFAGVLAVLLARSRWGFRLRMLGMNATTARRAGVSLVAVGGGALMLSGGFAGLAGGVMLTGTVFRLQAGFSNNVGWEGLLVALVARNRALLCVPTAFFFGALRSGGGFLASTGVPRYLVQIVQALLVLASIVPPLVLEVRRRRRAASAVQEGA